MITSSKISSAPWRVRELAQAGQEARRGRHHAHVAGHRLHDHRRDLAPAAREARLDRVEVVERHGERVSAASAAGTPQAVGHAEAWRRPSRP